MTWQVMLIKARLKIDTCVKKLCTKISLKTRAVDDISVISIC